jgi:hypothetical protein
VAAPRSRHIAVPAEHAPRRSSLTTLWAIVALTGCGAVHPLTPPVAVPSPDAIAGTLLLIGDAGNPRPTGDPVLEALTRMAAEAPERSAVVFLGDNVYPLGVPDSAAPERAEAERRLTGQIAAVQAAGARGIFIPGNHDWARQGSSGWDAVRREEALVLAAGGGLAFLPGGGCPGPAVVDVGAHVRLVFLDTQWWLHGGPRPEPPDTSCLPDTESGVVDSLRGSLAAAAGRLVVVAGHHPLASGGPHGGHFDWKDHIFPLRSIAPWLWVPLPVIGSLYPFARQHGVSAQDFSAGKNRRLRAALDSAFAERPPLVYVSGHEHTLQVFAREREPYILVSGTGYFEHSSPVHWLEYTRYASNASGFMRIDVLRDGRARLGVWTVARDGTAGEAFSMWLRETGVH